ncbi:hypothetical protein QJQ45_004204 [Haematococcus lacustris]|nr:hypothetical protein QJQ45_004204 [Haematococcus lacustris]
MAKACARYGGARVERHRKRRQRRQFAAQQHWSQLSRIKVHIEEAKDLTMYARHSTAISDLLRKQRKDSGSKQKLQPPSNTRMHSLATMLDSIAANRQPLVNLALDEASPFNTLPRGTSQGQRKRVAGIKAHILDESWWAYNCYLRTAMQPLPAAGSFGCEEAANFSELAAMSKLFNERVAYGETGALYATGLLDPRYHGRHTELTHSQVMMADMCIAELASADGQANPCMWWQTDGHGFGVLRDVAMRLLSIPATSASTERVFSTSKHIWSDHRQSMLMGRMWMSSYIYFNRRALKGTRGQTRSSEEERAEFEEWLQHQPNGISE